EESGAAAGASALLRWAGGHRSAGAPGHARDGERTAGEAAAAADLSPSNASKHLACLRDCGLVESRQDWRHVHYRLADSVSQVLDANDLFIDRVVDRIAACQRPEMRRV